MIRTHLTNDGYHIDLKSIGHDKLTKTINDLTVRPFRLDATEEELDKGKFTVYRYDEKKETLIVPRYYGIQKFGMPRNIQFTHEKVEMKFYSELRLKQKDVVDKCLRYFEKYGGGLLSVPCGFGKTVCALFIAQHLGLKTLVVVHKTFLLVQWINKAIEFLKIPKSKIGIIRQKVCEVEGKDIVFATIQTIGKKDHKNIRGKFGFVIYDEAHHICCRTYSRALLKTGARYTMALTATPYRGDGLIKVMYWFTGGTVYREKMKINKNVVVKMINYKSNHKLFKLKMRWFQGKVRPDTGKMTTNICEIPERNDAIAEIITHIRRNNPDRKILILSGRKNHLTTLKQMVDGEILSDIKEGILEKDEVCSCYYTGETTPHDREIAEESGDIIFATYDMAHEGLDIKQLNTVILASPKKDVVQSVGRIMRNILKSGDCRPMIIDFGDDIDGIRKWGKIRTEMYGKCKYEIEDYYLKENMYLSSLEYSGLKITNHDMHHPDRWINRAMNNYNEIMDRLKQDIIEFEKLTGDKLEYNEIKETEYKVLNELEYVDLSDIMFVPKLTDEDFDHEVVKDTNVDDSMNLDNEIMDGDKEGNEFWNIGCTTINKPKVPQKRLF
ncbi:MAG: superfamily II DNA or RNA helicase [Dasosvirus sp.]|uniref:Superfamily II DNA or RNA helicase n=1 Tax=Dasosvirus sp. TaxID=2487764 RepID=A0A3G4ZRN3_9VIRU|nr:MAG: superfamily II DNA or RNA helicase [Dasosvirus sp.]